MANIAARRFVKRLASLGPILLESILYAGFAAAYFFLVLHLLDPWLKQVFDGGRFFYGLLAVALIGAQGSLLERLTTGLLGGIRFVLAIIPALRRLARPYETVIRPAQVPGLLVYRFAGPLLFLNAAHFARRVQELVDEGGPPVSFLLINAEAIVDADTEGIQVLEELGDSLAGEGIVLGLCEVKGHFRNKLEDMGRRPGFRVYPSLAVVLEELAEKQQIYSEDDEDESPDERDLAS